MRHIRIWPRGADSAEVDDAPVACFLHRRHKGLDHTDRRKRVLLINGNPVFAGSSEPTTLFRRAVVVDQDVEPVSKPVNLFGDRRRAFIRGDVAGDGAPGADLLANPVSLSRSLAVDDYPRAFPCELSGDDEACPPVAAGDQRNLVLEAKIHLHTPPGQRGDVNTNFPRHPADFLPIEVSG